MSIFLALQRISLGVALALAGVCAQAQETHKSLNTDNITAFIMDTTEITAGKKQTSHDTISKYLNDHINAHAYFKTLIKYTIPNYGTQESTLNLNKDEFIAQVEQGTSAIDDYDAQIEILDIKISKDKTKAIVHTRSEERGTMNIPVNANETAASPLAGVSVCTQILSLSEDGVIQMFNASCVTNMQFSTL